MADFGFGNYDFSNIMQGFNLSDPVVPAQKTGLMDQIFSNPEFLAIALDKMGTAMDPNNPMAGVGGFLGQSSLANKAMQEQKQERKEWRDLIAGMISGKMPLTPAGEPGVSGATIKPGKEPGTSELSFSVTEPTDTKKKEKSMDLGSIMSSPFWQA